MPRHRSVPVLACAWLLTLTACTPQPEPPATVTLNIAPGATCPPVPSDAAADSWVTPSLGWLEATHSAVLLLIPQSFQWVEAERGNAGHWLATATVLEVRANWGELPIRQGRTVRYISAAAEAKEPAGTLETQGQAWRPVLAFVSREGEDKDIYTGAEGFPAYWFCRSETGELLENRPSEQGVREAVAERYGL